MSTAAVLNGLRDSQQQLAEAMKTEWDNLKAKRELAAGNDGQLQKLNDRKEIIQRANELLTDSITHWEEAKKVLLDDDNESLACTLIEEVQHFYNEALRLFTSDTAKPEPQPSPAKDPGDKVVAPSPITPEPIKAPEAEEGNANDSGNSNEEPAWVGKLQESLTGTLRSHTEDCNRQFTEFREVLEELTKSSLTPEHAAVLGNFSPDELKAILEGGTLSTQDSNTLAWVASLRSRLVDERLGIEDLVYAAKLGRKARGISSWSREKRGYLPRRNN